ncbi:glycosyl transferase [Burkholderia sp. Nafp2/4-1b]|uniref:glycosyltransferase family protein n=1 Tax=Burkholderia sp. Nafp2/4-1b TaxID=2116686 RepID=UPI000EF8A2AE|nr:glycosyltransferase [Burkholderia sp. Nafp2/4-1b]RKU01842.1 glycosyl transferase [Burkholderia sp. Nafp2/4-1b]
MNDSPRIFAPLGHPYYVSAPPYLQTSGGVRAMHYLCHALNVLGCEAYINTADVHPELRTPLLTKEIAHAHFAAGRSPVAVYPEIVEGNPFNARCVARYLLAEPGRINGKPIDRAPTDLVFTFGPSIVPEGWQADLLRIPLVDTRIFHCDGVDDATRRGTAVFLNRHLRRGGSLHPATAESIEISSRVAQRSAHELAELFRRVECLYLYEWSTAAFEALLCGCPVVCILNDASMPNAERWVMGGKGIAWGLDPHEIAHAKATVHEARDVYREEEATFWQQLRQFVDKTQARANELDAQPGQNGAAIARPAAAAAAPRRMAVVSAAPATDPQIATRFVAPFRALEREWTVDFPVAANGIDLDALQRADVIVLHGATPSLLSGAALEQLFTLGKPVVCDLDRPFDAISLDDPELAGSARRLAAMRDAIRRADALVVQSDAMALTYRHVNAAVHALPADAEPARHGALYARLAEQGRRPAAATAKAPAPSTGGTPAPRAQQKKRLVAYAIDPVDGASVQRRLALPFARLEDDWALVSGLADSAAIATADAVLLDRHTPGLLSLKALGAIFEFDKPVIYATDLPLAAPSSMQTDPTWIGIAFTLGNAHAIIVPTPDLARQYRPWNPNVFVLPDSVDLDLFLRAVPARGNARVTIGVAGAALLPANFALVDAALRALCERHAGRIAVQFFGAQVPAGWEQHPAAEFRPAPDGYRAYAQQLRALDWDVALMPLANADDAAASAVQRQEFAAAGIAIVASDRPALRIALNDGDDALLAGDAAHAWDDALERMVAQPALRRRIARTAQARVRKHDALQARLPLIREVYRRCVEREGTAVQLPPRDTPIPGALILDADGDAERVQAALRIVASRAEQDLLSVVLTTAPGPLPEWTDRLRYVSTSTQEYAATADQLAAMPAFDWVAIIDAADIETDAGAPETAIADAAID